MKEIFYNVSLEKSCKRISGKLFEPVDLNRLKSLYIVSITE